MVSYVRPSLAHEAVDVYMPRDDDTERDGLPPELRDLSERLPPAGQAALQALRTQRDDAHALARRLSDRVDELRERRQDADRRLSGQHAISHRPLADDHPAIHGIHAELRKLDAEFARVAETRDLRTSAWHHLGQLVQRNEDYVDRLTDPIHGFTAEVTPSRRKGESLIDAIERARRKLRDLAADRRRVEHAPIPASQAKQIAREHVERLAQRGCPDVLQVLELGEAPTWPTTTIQAATHGMDAEGRPIRGFASVQIPDAIAALHWIHRAAIIAAYEAEIDELADDSQALSDDDRDARLAELDRDALALAREEEALVAAAEAEGQAIARRLDADPRAVLHLADTMPPPKE